MSDSPEIKGLSDDVLFGKLALEQGFVTQEQLREAMSE